MKNVDNEMGMRLTARNLSIETDEQFLLIGDYGAGVSFTTIDNNMVCHIASVDEEEYTDLKKVLGRIMNGEYKKSKALYLTKIN